MIDLINIYLTIWETEDQLEEKEESFKQSLMQAFPSMAKQIYGEEDDDNALGDDYEQILPSNMEEFRSLEDLLNNIQEMNVEDLEKS